MNSVLVHLALSHIPVVGVPIAALLLLWGMGAVSDDLRRAGLWLMLVIGLVAPIISQSGDAAEKKFENGTPTLASYIEKHEEAAEPAVWAAVALAVLAGAQLMFHWKKRRWISAGLWISLVGAMCLSGWFGWVAHLGGLIGHDVIRPPASQRVDGAP